MATNKWVPVTMDKRGSLFVPTHIKQSAGYQAGTIFFLRALGESLVLLPLERLMTDGVANGTDHQKDGALAVHLNEAWNNPKLTVAPSLYPKEDTLPELPPDQTVEADGFRHMVEMNKKGFIPIPDTVKEALDLGIGDKFLVEIRWNSQRRPVITIEQLIHQGAMDAFLEKKKQEHVVETQRQERAEWLKQRTVALRAEVQELEQRRDALVKQIATGKAPQGTFQQMLSGPAKPVVGTHVPGEEVGLSLQVMPRGTPDPVVQKLMASVLGNSLTPPANGATAFGTKVHAEVEKQLKGVHQPGHPLHEFEQQDLANSAQIAKELFAPKATVQIPNATELMGPDGKPIPPKTSLPFPAPAVAVDPAVLQPGNVWKDDPIFGRIQVPDDRE